MIRASASAWHGALARPAGARLRPAPGRWSALEYGCHVRGVLRLYDWRLEMMLTRDGPRYPDWDQDAAAAAGRYGEQDPAAAAARLAQAAETIAVRFEGLSPGEWRRTGTRSDGAHFTAESLARYLVHELVHHLYDVSGVQYADQPRPAT